MKFIFVVLCCVFINIVLSVSVYGQDVENIGSSLLKIKDAKPLKFSGGVNLGSGFYGVNGIPSRRAPFTWAINANMNISVYGKINVPLSINYTDNGTSYSAANPLTKIISDIANRTGISPKYKSVTVHLGDRSMNFSKYTYSGLRFFGGGFEWAPKNAAVKVSAFYGRFNRRTIRDTINGVYIAPSFERLGWGTKLEFGKERHKFGAIIFKAKDETFDGDILITRYGLAPQENLVLGFDTKHKIGKKLEFNFEYATSAYSLDARTNPLETSGNYNYFNNLGKLFVPGMATIYNDSYTGGIQFKEKKFTIGTTYLWVDPTYKSLGSIAAKNDIQAITLNSTVTTLGGKVMLAGNWGTERNNLDKNLALTMTRYIGSANITANLIEGLTLTYTYSNFNHSTAPQTITKADSIKLVQVNSNHTASANYSLGKSNLKHTFMLSGTSQNVQDIKEIFNQQIMTPNDVKNALGSYSLNIVNINLTNSLSFMYNEVTAPSTSTISYGPSLTVSKKLFAKKMNLSFVVTGLTNSEILAKSSITNYKVALQYKLGKYQSFKMDGSIIDKTITVGEGKSFTEFLGKFSYDFSF